MQTVEIAIIGCGGITLQNHLPGFRMCPNAKIVALCDSDPVALERARKETGIEVVSTDYKEIIDRHDVDAVVIATPNYTHYPIAMYAISRRKHILCEKPIAMNYTEAITMAESADKAGIRHSTAFTYRFVPAMRYLRELVKRGDLGQPYHYRSCRLQDWGTRNLGWRQVKKLAGTGELGDMLSHRIDFAHILVGKIERLVADMKYFHNTRGGAPNDLEDWVAIIARFCNGATGVLESSKLASGRNESWRSLDYVELNGSEATFVYLTEEWNKLRIGKRGGESLTIVDVPKEYWKLPGSPRDPSVGNPLITFRYDQSWDFVDAIINNRPCNATFYDGAAVQAVMDAAVKSAETGQWIKPQSKDS